MSKIVTLQDLQRSTQQPESSTSPSFALTLIRESQKRADSLQEYNRALENKVEQLAEENADLRDQLEALPAQISSIVTEHNDRKRQGPPGSKYVAMVDDLVAQALERRRKRLLQQRQQKDPSTN